MARKHSRILTPLAVIALVAAFGGGLLVAGPLNPPAGPVTGTYKTLTEVEPRTAINAANTPGDATSVFKITQPGSYYLTADPGLIPTGKHGILIAASNVALDLNGFQVWSQGAATNALDGVSAAAGTAHITVCNGITRNMKGDGVDLSLATECRVENIQAMNNSANGISVGANSTAVGCTARQNVHGLICADNGVVERCISTSNLGNGITTGHAGSITDCSASSNTSVGFIASSGATISNCSAYENSAEGFVSGAGCTFARCAAYGNGFDGISAAAGSTIVNCSAYSNIGNGFVLQGGSFCTTISDCTSANNGADGIRCSARSVIRGNTCSSGGNGGDGAGIHVLASDNRIEDNTCTTSDRGIDVDAPGNIILRNACAGNTADWDIAAGNVCGPILDRRAPASSAITGFVGASSLGSTDANANFSY